jgi:hypothetical protein
MYFHIVLFKIRPNATEAELENLFAGFRSLSAVPGVRGVAIETINNKVYLGYDDRTKGYTHALTVYLKDKASVESYDKDSFHNTVKATIVKPMLDCNAKDPVLAVDWEGEMPKLKTCPITALTSPTALTAFAVGGLAGIAAASFVLLRRSRL